jgi:hypothetical protein
MNTQRKIAQDLGVGVGVVSFVFLLIPITIIRGIVTGIQVAWEYSETI